MSWNNERLTFIYDPIREWGRCNGTKVPATSHPLTNAFCRAKNNKFTNVCSNSGCNRFVPMQICCEKKRQINQSNYVVSHNTQFVCWFWMFNHDFSHHFPCYNKENRFSYKITIKMYNIFNLNSTRSGVVLYFSLYLYKNVSFSIEYFCSVVP